MSKRYIIFCCYGSPEIGFGHIVGSIRFANLLKKELSITPVFLVKQNDSVIDHLDINNFQYSVLPQEADVSAQIIRINELSRKYITRIVSFNFNADELKLWGDNFLQLKEQGLSIIFQDNPMPSFWHGDLVINALPHPDYPDYNPEKHNHCFDGLEYLLLEEEIIKFQKREKIVNGTVEQILISLGGSDHKNITSLLLKILADIQCNAFIDVVLGPASENISEVEKAIQALSLNAHLSFNVNNMPERIWNADVGFSTLGLTTYEMAALNLPCLIIAPNHLNAQVAELYVNKYSLAEYAGLIDRLDYEELKVKTNNFLMNKVFHEKIRSEKKQIGNSENYKQIVSFIKEIIN